MGFDTQGAPQFGLNDVKIALWTSTGVYGTAVDVPSVQMMGVNLDQITAKLEGDDKITATQAMAIGGTIQLRFGSVSLLALEVMLGNAITSSVASPNQVKQIKIAGGDTMPYFGICGKALAAQGGGDFHVFLPMVKLASQIQLANLQYGQFAIPEMTIDAVDDETYGVVSLITHQTAVAVVIPPANIV